MQTKTLTNPVTLLPDAELTREIGLMQRRAARKVEDARRHLKTCLTRIAESAARQAERLDSDMYLDTSSLRHLCDPSDLAECFAALREAEMMAATVAELIEEPGQ